MRFGERRGKSKEFDSIEARCNACKVYGGTYNPCLKPALLASYRREQERLRRSGEHAGPPHCPRVILDPENATAAEMAMWCLNESLRNMVPRKIALKREIEGWSPGQEDAVLDRVAAVVGSRLVHEAMDADAKARAEETKAAK